MCDARFKKLFNTKEYHIKKIGKGQHAVLGKINDS